ncbi:MAG: hypothetical protein A3J97_00700 [Spirochaetes bacterium RIFOXYC1_FULL_54_7]|nr:MAG: hypothetical protein A3J97_00700 [Spirochaetes bacterium RIFOXYC1_FULL_54_7]
MAKKITLTVNENLFSKIDQWRSSFNLSKLFQDAVSEAIKAKEEFHRMLSGKEDIPGIVERLKAEKRGWLETARRDGESDGGTWAGKAHYSELISVLALIDSKRASDGDGEAISAAEDQCVEVWERKRKVAAALSPELEDAIRGYREGWRAGVAGLWEIVKDQLDEK